MARVKRGMMHVKRRKNIMAKVRGYKHGRKNLIKLAQTAIIKSGASAFRERKRKKRLMRMKFNVQINAGLRPLGTKYSVFMNQLKKHGIALDRKVLADMAGNNPEVFKKLVESVK